MKVQELIDFLKDHDPRAEVLSYDGQTLHDISPRFDHVTLEGMTPNDTGAIPAVLIQPIAPFAVRLVNGGYQR